MSRGAREPGPIRPMLEELYRAYRQRLYAFFWSRTGSREDALDLLQELFLRAWRNAESLAEMPEPRRLYWLFACARRLGIDHHRHRQVVANAEQVQDGEPQDPGRGDPSLRLEHSETWRAVDRAIRELPDPLREVLVMKVMGEMPSSEIGIALGIPAGTVRYRLMRARQALARALEGTPSTPGRGGT